MLVRSYKGYLKMLEGEIKSKSYDHDWVVLMTNRTYATHERVASMHVRTLILGHAFQF
jgi:hypothetical protein